MYDIKVNTAPDYDELPLADVKAWLKVEHSEEDEIIEMLRNKAWTMLEKFCGASFGVQERVWLVDLTCETEIPYGPIVSVDTVTYADGEDYTAATEDSDYYVDGNEYKTFQPSFSGRWSVTYTAGKELDDETKTAILVQTAHLYEKRSGGISADAKKSAEGLRRNLI